jgi:hypothetical protein
MAHELHQIIRVRFDFRCGYCGTSELQSGGELTIDHFQPQSAGGSDSLENLVYACFRCNLFKGDFWPSSETTQQRLLHPIRDISEDHFRLQPETGRLIPYTETGRFHIDWLHLNRTSLIERRRNDHRNHQYEQYISLLEEIITTQEELIRLYEEGLR